MELSETEADLDSDYSDDSETEEDYDLDLLQLNAAPKTIDDLTFDLIHIDSPAWFMNAKFKVFFNERSTYDSVAACSPLTLAPGLDDVLSSPTPPSVDFFSSLPSPPSYYV